MKYRAEIVKTIKWTEEVEAESFSEAEDLFCEGKGDRVMGSTDECEWEECDYDTIREVP